MYIIRRATLEDAAAILAIQRLAFAEEGRLCNDPTIPPLTEPVEEVLEHIRTQTVFAACMGTQVVGSARGIRSGTDCTIRGVSVHPRHQGKSLGSELLRTVEQAHPRATMFDLLTNPAVPGNVDFYRRHGYVVTELRRFTYAIELAYMTKATAARDD